jgi:hypothetical protein
MGVTSSLSPFRSATVVRRGLRYAVGVGGILVAINHGDALLDGDLSSGRLLRMGLTVLVPFFVSALSSVAALKERASSLESDTTSVVR